MIINFYKVQAYFGQCDCACEQSNCNVYTPQGKNKKLIINFE